MRDPFVHDAFLYAGEHEFVAGAVPFVRAGIEAEEPVLVVVGAAKIDLLREALAGDAAHVRFADMTAVGANPARIIPAWRQFVDDHVRDGRGRGIGEPIWPGRTDGELVECHRHEALLNLAFAGTPFELLCPYDTAGLPDAVVEEALANHPLVIRDGSVHASDAYRGLDAIAGPFDEPLPDPPVRARELPFTRETLASARRLVYVAAAHADLNAARMHNVVLAMHEVATGLFDRGSGSGVLRVWEDEDSLACELRAEARIEAPLAGREEPTSRDARDADLWVANQLCDLVQVRTFPDGSTVRLHVRRG